MEILDEQKDNRKSRLVLPGIILILLGLLLLFTNNDWISDEWRHFFVSWPMLLVALGVISLIQKKVVPGILLIIVGGYFLLPRIPFQTWFDPHIFHKFWPLILVFAGVFFIVYRARSGSGNMGISQTKKNTVDGRIHFSYILSGNNYVYDEPVFYGGEIETVLGGMTLDLTHTALPEGITDLSVSAVFGGITIIVPSDWQVTIRNDGFLGSFSDKRSTHALPADTSRTLLLHAEAVFGGGELRSSH